MKIRATLLMVVILLVAVARGGEAPQTNTPIADPTVKLGLPQRPGPVDLSLVVRTIWKNLDKAKHVCSENFDYGPEGGIRTFGCRLMSMVAYRSLSQMAMMKPFLSGPHTSEGLNLSDERDFGRYNPAFVDWMVEHFIPAESDSALRAATQGQYDKYVRPLARQAWVVAMEADRDPKRFSALVKEYQNKLKSGKPIVGSYEEYDDFMNNSPFAAFAGAQHVSLDAPVASPTAAFWIRRTVDGSRKNFQRGLRKLLSVYDRNFLEKALQVAKNPPQPPASAPEDDPEFEGGAAEN